MVHSLSFELYTTVGTRARFSLVREMLGKGVLSIGWLKTIERGHGIRTGIVLRDAVVLYIGRHISKLFIKAGSISVHTKTAQLHWINYVKKFGDVNKTPEAIHAKKMILIGIHYWNLIHHKVQIKSVEGIDVSDTMITETFQKAESFLKMYQEAVIKVSKATYSERTREFVVGAFSPFWKRIVECTKLP